MHGDTSNFQTLVCALDWRNLTERSFTEILAKSNLQTFPLIPWTPKERQRAGRINEEHWRIQPWGLRITLPLRCFYRLVMIKAVIGGPLEWSCLKCWLDTLHSAQKPLKKPTEKWWIGKLHWSSHQRSQSQKLPQKLFSGIIKGLYRGT